MLSGNFRGSGQLLREKYLERAKLVQQKVKFLMDTASRDTWKCDPRQYSVGTYEEVTNFLQGYLDNEVNLNQENDCKNSCPDYKLAEHHMCHNGTYCAQQPEGAERDRSICRGKIVDCDFFGSDLNVCKSVSEKSNAASPQITAIIRVFLSQNNPNRRYDLIKYDNGNVFGREAERVYQSCESTSFRVESWTRWFVQCSNCFCLCDEQINSERSFSLRDVVSNIHRNQ